VLGDDLAKAGSMTKGFMKYQKEAKKQLESLV